MLKDQISMCVLFFFVTFHMTIGWGSNVAVNRYVYTVFNAYKDYLCAVNNL